MVEIAEALAPAGGTLLTTPFSYSFSSHSFPLVSGCHSLQHFVTVMASLKSLPLTLYLVPATFSLSLLNLCYMSDPNAETLHRDSSLCNCCAQQALLTWTEDRWPHSGDAAMIHNTHVSLRFPLSSHSSVFFGEPMFFHSDWLDTFSASIRPLGHRQHIRCRSCPLDHAPLQELASFQSSSSQACYRSLPIMGQPCHWHH
jgi:hypothetical protein